MSGRNNHVESIVAPVNLTLLTDPPPPACSASQWDPFLLASFPTISDSPSLDLSYRIHAPTGARQLGGKHNLQYEAGRRPTNQMPLLLCPLLIPVALLTRPFW